jgi:dTDP-4-amino-4,6-dideoxygalactose transaminase
MTCSTRLEFTMNVLFNKPHSTGNELKYIQEAISNHHLSGDGPFGKKCHAWLEQKLNAKKVLLTPSGTAALEMMALLLDIKDGDEVIMPSYTFVSTANAFVLRGAVPVFVDIRPDTINLDEKLIRKAITKRTRAIVPVHYAGVGCVMDTIMDLSREFDIAVVEDAAHAVLAEYKNRPLGSIGHMAALSFHETKNLISGEGGALIINDEKYIDRAEIIREKGTNRSLFFRGQVDKYRWMDVGSSYLPSELQSAYLWAQFEEGENITARRLEIWHRYYELLKEAAAKNWLTLPVVPSDCAQNGHLFYVMLSHGEHRDRLLQHLREKGVSAMFHYVPLHTAPAAAKYCRISGDLLHTENAGERLIRLPFFNDITVEQQMYVVDSIADFFKSEEQKSHAGQLAARSNN